MEYPMDLQQKIASVRRNDLSSLKLNNARHPKMNSHLFLFNKCKNDNN